MIFNGPEQSTICRDDEFEYIVDVFTNRKPEETSWVLEYQGSRGNIAAKRTGQYDEMLHLYRETGCMKYGCSLFLIKDSEFNGLCCTKGMGSYTIKVGNEIKIKGDSFNDRQDIEQFCHYKEDEEEEESTPSPTALVCDADEFKYQVDIETDLFPDEIRWELTKPQIDGVKHGFYSRENFDHIHAGCLDFGDCYALTGAEGRYEVKVEDMILVPDGLFEEKVQTFCYLSDTLQPSLKPSFQPSSSSQPTSSLSMQPSTEPTITTSPSMFICSEKESYSFFNIVVNTDLRPLETSWVLTDEDGTLIDSVETGDYDDNFNKYEHSYCLMSSKCYSFQIKDSGGDGLSFNRKYEVSVNGVVMAEGGGNFGNEETKSICYDGETNSPTLTPSSKPSSSPIVCNENEFRYDLIVKLDWDPYQTSWELNYRDSGEEIGAVEYSYDEKYEEKLHFFAFL